MKTIKNKLIKNIVIEILSIVSNLNFILLVMWFLIFKKITRINNLIPELEMIYFLLIVIGIAISIGFFSISADYLK